MDGTPEIHDLALADARCNKLFGTVLTVVNLACDPLELYAHFKSIGLRGVDFLLPEANYDRMPPGFSLDSNATPYADWLITVFDEWFGTGDASFRIRLFDNIIALIFGCEVSTDSIGGRKNDALVIETDGGLELATVLQGCGNALSKLGKNVVPHQNLAHP